MNDSATRFRRVAETMTATIDAVPDDAWDNPAPCEGWVARDVVAHMAEWIPGPGFLLGSFGIEAGPVPSADDDPAGAWAAVRDAVQRGLDDPEIVDRMGDCGPIGEMPYAAAIDMMVTSDVLVHTWDLATAAGIEVELDPTELRLQAASVAHVPPEADAAMRASGHFGPRVDVADDADDLTRTLAFFGRRIPS